MFNIEEHPTLPLELGGNLWTRVTFERHLDRFVYSRTRYTVLDLLANFGGFMGIFRWIFGTFMGAWNTNGLDNFMITKLYKMQEPEQKVKGDASPFVRSRWPHLMTYLLSWVPSPFVGCKKSSTEIA